MIRDARREDAIQIGALLQSSFEPKLRDFIVYAQHGINRFLAALIAFPRGNEERRFLVDENENEEICAFAEFQKGADDTAFLSYICVAEETRGAGLASGLIRYYIQTASPLALQLDVFKQNRAALGLYRKLGFEHRATTSWIVRELPNAELRAPLSFENAPEACAMHACYGFCRFTGQWNGNQIDLGRIGDRTIRCFDEGVLADDNLLATIHATFSEVTNVLLVSFDRKSNLPAGTTLLQSSLRLVLQDPSNVGWLNVHPHR